MWRISPLKALNFYYSALKRDLIILDYRVRGFTRDVNGKNIY